MYIDISQGTARARALCVHQRAFLRHAASTSSTPHLLHYRTPTAALLSDSPSTPRRDTPRYNTVAI